MAEYDFFFNIFLVGGPGTGKSSILNRYTDNYFTDSYNSSTEVYCKYKTIQIENSTIKLQIMDSSDRDRHRALLSSLILSYNKLPNAIIVVFDKNYRKTYDRFELLVEQLRSYALPSTLFVLVGNKCDLESRVSTDELQEKVLMYQVLYIEVSAKTGEQIGNLFEIVARMLFYENMIIREE